MRRPVPFVLCLLVILAAASVITYYFGMRLLHDTSITCKAGPGKSVGCYTGLGAFGSALIMGVALAVGAAWSRFGRY